MLSMWSIDTINVCMLHSFCVVSVSTLTSHAWLKYKHTHTNAVNLKLWQNEMCIFILSRETEQNHFKLC